MRGPPPESRDDMINLLRLYRGYAEHENELINHRTTWFITLQSVLIATFGFSLQKYYEVAEKVYEYQAIHSINIAKSLSVITNEMFASSLILNIVGISSCVAAYFGVNAAIVAQRHLEADWRLHFHRKAEEFHLPFMAGGRDGPAVENGDLWAKRLPVLFGICWVALLLFVLIKFTVEKGMS